MIDPRISSHDAPTSRASRAWRTTPSGLRRPDGHDHADELVRLAIGRVAASRSAPSTRSAPRGVAGTPRAAAPRTGSSSPARGRSRRRIYRPARPRARAARKIGIVISSSSGLKSTVTGMPIAQLVVRRALDVGHHPRAFVELDDGRDVRHPLVERRQVVLHARSNTCRAFPGPTPASTRRRRSSTSGRTAAGRSGPRCRRCSAARGTRPRGSRPRTAASPCRASGCRNAGPASLSPRPAGPRRPRPGSSPRPSR